MKKKNKYSVFGLTVLSDLFFSELLSADNSSEIDVEIISELAPIHIKDLIDKGHYCGIENDIFYMNLSNNTILCVCEGNKISVDMVDDSTIEISKLFVLGTCFGILLMQRGIIPLHGSAVKYKNKGIVILGDSGSGKSTLMRNLINRGARVLSDDVIPITVKDGIYEATFSYPQQKLSDDSLMNEGLEIIEEKKIPYLAGNRQKYYLNISDDFYHGTVPIDFVINLLPKEIESPIIKVVKGGEQLEIVMNNIYRYQFLKDLKRLDKSLEVAVGIANQSKVCLLERPISGFTVDRQISLIEDVMREE